MRIRNRARIRPIGTALIAALLAAMSPAGAQERCRALDDMPNAGDLRRMYRESSIRIEADPNVPISLNPESRKWRAYQGFLPISEETFFTICAGDASAERARKHKSGADGLKIAGIAVMGVGLLLAIIGEAQEDKTCADSLCLIESNRNAGLLISGILVSVGGLVATLVGVEKGRSNWATYHTASQLADEYNRELCRDLSER